MKSAAITFLVLFCCAQASAQVLTLDCRFESEAHNGVVETPTSGAFSAIVHITSDRAKVDATTGCEHYVGHVDEHYVYGKCELLEFIKTSLAINRVDGEFEETVLSDRDYTIYHGHCTPKSFAKARTNHTSALRNQHRARSGY